jgi:hypothetical protein
VRLLLGMALASDPEVITAVNNSRSVSGVLHLLQRSKVGTNYKLVLEAVVRLNLDTRHWGKPRRQTRDLRQVFVEESVIDRGQVKRLIIRESLIPYLCELCGLGSNWNNKKLVLRLDHRNGVRNDDRLENLRFLCPNCDSQTDTFCGRNRPKGKDPRHRCLDCPAMTTGPRCRSCSSKHQHKLNPQPTKIVWPPIPQIQAALQASNMLAVAKTLGVSDNALRKHLRHNSV